eukprot:1525795-Pleurochrysis_carterae.AAC.2
MTVQTGLDPLCVGGVRVSICEHDCECTCGSSDDDDDGDGCNGESENESEGQSRCVCACACADNPLRWAPQPPPHSTILQLSLWRCVHLQNTISHAFAPSCKNVVYSVSEAFVCTQLYTV